MNLPVLDAVRIYNPFTLKINLFVAYIYIYIYILIGIHSMEGSTATMRHRVIRKEEQKRLQDTENLFRKNLQLKDVC